MRYGDHCAAAPSQQREQQVDLEGASSSHYSAADDVAREVESLLDQFSQLVGARMDACLAQSDEGGGRSGGVFARQLRDSLQHDRAEFHRMRDSMRHRRERSELFGSLGGKPATGSGSGGDAQQHLLRERSSIRSSSSSASSVIEQAHETRRALKAQRSVFVAARGKLIDVGRAFPRVGNMIKLIKRSRNRDAIVLSLVIACCLFFLFWWSFLRRR